ncbi:MAG TPA: hypothetical protein VFG21_07695 [Xanthomonadaceae bacterium]|nr:hypothetical protein [Xanthomonadaceae bacterium]
MNKSFSASRALPVLLLATLAAGCSRQAPPEERAAERWDLLVAGKADQAWDYLTPGYRQTRPRELYAAEIAVRPVRWTSAEVMGVECPEQDRCMVKVKIDYSLRSQARGVGMIESYVVSDETWIRSDRGWFHLPPEAAK